MYLVPATFIPDWAIWSVLPNLAIKPFSSSGVTCNISKDTCESQLRLRKQIGRDCKGFKTKYCYLSQYKVAFETLVYFRFDLGPLMITWDLTK